MEFQEIGITGAFLFSSKVFEDNRGSFTESFKQDFFSNATDTQFRVAQVNTSVSKVNTLRGIHTADSPPGQAKYVMCSSGEIDDFVIDLRRGSPTFLTWKKVTLSSDNRDSLYIPAGLGHGFVAKSQTAVVTYLCDYPHAPDGEYGINPFDSELGIEWGLTPEEALISSKDLNSPSFNSLEIQSRLSLFSS